MLDDTCFKVTCPVDWQQIVKFVTIIHCLFPLPDTVVAVFTIPYHRLYNEIHENKFPARTLNPAGLYIRFNQTVRYLLHATIIYGFLNDVLLTIR